MKREPFLQRLKKSVLVCDGAMGTMLYARGIFINRCFDELNITDAPLILSIHKEYVAARADIIETNTFGANRFKLQPHGLDDQVQVINQRGAELARQAAGENLYVAGSIGPLGIQVEPLGTVKKNQARSAFQQQAEGLLAGGVDLFILETFGDVQEISLAIEAVRAVSSLPIVAQMTFDAEGKTLLGVQPETVVQILSERGADVLGANCSVGPQPMLEVIERMAKTGARFLSAQPNAGNPRLIDGRLLYMSTPEYHAEFARRFIAAGASIVGGCCGTTPHHIRSIANAVRSLQPRKLAGSLSVATARPLQVTPVPREQKSALAARLGKKFVVSVEVLPPRGTDVSAVVDGVRKLVGFGIDAVNIPDGPRASSRMSPMALAQILERALPVETILHYCCRDRNLLGMQSDLLGHHALGLRNILVVTGDPPKLGDYPDATAVFDVDSIGLTRIIHGLNHGFDVAGNPIGPPTAWHIGVGVNPGAVDLDLEIDRLRRKVEAGAEYILTQPVFDIKQLTVFFNRITDVTIPVLAGIMPLINYRTVEFLNNEVPGVHVPEKVAKRLAGAKNSEDAKNIGVHIARETVLSVREMEAVKGLYLMPPFSKDKYDIALSVLEAFRL
ncbi:bifunctional homocysteine S-methyltransferase/methylenetetrahydrofolate reductase [candidate division KSB1 bacterium]|nr:bifunctional homocysteine S-methyltransferase/methylenetetrahydrofolate reductase [candidate division KSB1 bacterium]